MVSTTINTGEIVLEVTDPAFVLDPGRLRRLVFDGGATLHAIRLEGVGRLEHGRAVFCGSGQALDVDRPSDFSPPEGKDALLEGRMILPREGAAASRMTLTRVAPLSD